MKKNKEKLNGELEIVREEVIVGRDKIERWWFWFLAELNKG